MLPATVHFADGDEDGRTAEVKNVIFKEGGWVGLLADDGWVYYPPQKIERVVSRKQ